MKLKPNSSQRNRELAGDISRNLDSILGGRGSFSFVYFFVSSLIGFGSVGSKIIVRKNLGIRTINLFHLFLHVLIIYLYLTDALFSTPISLKEFFNKHHIVSLYLAIIFILAFIHYFEYAVLKKNRTKHTFDRGDSIFNYLFNSYSGVKSFYVRLIDPFLIGLISLALLSHNDTKPLAQILLVSSFFLLLEELLILYRTWQTLLDIQDTEKEAEWLTESHEAFQKNTNSDSEKSKRTVFRVRAKK